MARLIAFFDFLQPISSLEELVTAYVPLSARPIPYNELEKVIRGWLCPELEWVKAYSELENAIKSQDRSILCERYPHTDAICVVAELQVPPWLVFPDNNQLKINLREERNKIIVANIYVTARYTPGFLNEDFLPGDEPYDGTVHEVIPFYTTSF